MKPLEEIEQMLATEVCNSIYNITPNLELRYYNELLGDTSFLLAGLLQHYLTNDFNDWDTTKWFDDSLLTKVSFNKKMVSIWGIMIWGQRGCAESMD